MTEKTPIETARAARQKAVVARVRDAVDELKTLGCRISFHAVARQSDVARSTLYRNQELRDLICNARDEDVRRAQESSGLSDLRKRIAKLEEELRLAQAECNLLRMKRPDGESFTYRFVNLFDAA